MLRNINLINYERLNLIQNQGYSFARFVLIKKIFVT